MKNQLPCISENQWEFLSSLYAFGLPVSLELIGTVSPLPPAEFIDLQEKAVARGWIKIAENHFYEISKKLPEAVKKILGTKSSPQKIDSWIKKINLEKISNHTDQAAMANLLHLNSQFKAAAEIENNLADHSLHTGEYKLAITYLEKSVFSLSHVKNDRDSRATYVKRVLKLSDFTFALGKGFDKLPSLIQITRESIRCAEQSGNKRLLAMAHLHLGRLQLFSELRTEALSSLDLGRKQIEELGDEDSCLQASVFIGIYYYIQGKFFQAIEYFKNDNRALDSGLKEISDPCSSILLGYSAAYIGQLSLAIGSLDYNWRRAIANKNATAACTIRSTLGTVLLLIGKNREGYFHLREAINEAEISKNSLAIYFGRAGLALYHCLENRYPEAFNLLSLNLTHGIDSGSGQLFSSPWVLEIYYEAGRRNVQIDIPGFSLLGCSFREELHRIINTPNMHLKGVALRIKAKLLADENQDMGDIKRLLDESERCLTVSGDQVQLAKTRIEKVRFYLKRSEVKSARDLARRARQGLSGYSEDAFPDDLRYLLEGYYLTAERSEICRPNLQLFLDMIDELSPSLQTDEILTKMVAMTNRFFGGERGGLFWFENGKNSFRLRASHNITKSDILKTEFRSCLAVIHKAFRQGSSIVTSVDNRINEFQKTQSVLCIPFTIRERTGGVLYHENSYLDGCFDLFEQNQLERLSAHLAAFVKRLAAQEDANDSRKKHFIEYSLQNKFPEKSEFLYQSDVVGRLLDKADNVANSSASVLILGETGVGKGLLANRMHEMSSRRDKPLVIVDMTTIPENLVESELFGYEKGAFTGANRQKPGRLELAHKGTLFIDEIGEISQAIQVKLLRAIQEKRFVRIGGTRVLESDFRLIAATNRILSTEMMTGNFRSDLLFRINTITLTLPPLRDRGKDILLLAKHFFSYFANKHKRARPQLTKADEKKLMAYSWPGNVRELMNLAESSILLSTGDKLEMNFPFMSARENQNPFSKKPSLDELQKEYISYVLAETGGQVGGPGGAVETLKVKRTTLNARMKKLGISPESFRKPF